MTYTESAYVLCDSSSYAIRVKAGANANAAALASFSLISDAYDGAEGEIIAATRIDWVTNYSTIASGAKLALKEAASDLAAMKVISYDMSNFTKLSEAQTMLNVLRDNATRNIEMLKEFKKSEIKAHT